MHHIIPAIIPTSRDNLVSELLRARFAPRVQIDIVDGRFASPASWPYVDHTIDISSIVDALSTHYVMVDLMVVDPYEAAVAWLKIGVEELVIHLETISSLEDIVALKHQFDFKLYIAGDDDLPIERYQTWLHDVDGIQLMGIGEVGQQGQPFSPKVLQNIIDIRAIAPKLPIVIDGSVNKETITHLLHAGADNFVVGSAIVKASDPRAAYQTLTDLVRSAK